MDMNTKYISKKADERIIEYIEERAYEPILVHSKGAVGENISCHPDVFMCRLGAEDNSPLFIGDATKLSPDYPGDIRYNAACTGRYFIHNLKYTDSDLLKEAKDRGMILIDVKQGYSKCSTVIVDESAIITYDKGIAKACKPYEDLKVLLIEPGHIRLDGFDTGFIGGASGRLGNEIVFNGDLTKHPDFFKIIGFIDGRNLKCNWIPYYELTDIGSIL